MGYLSFGMPVLGVRCTGATESRSKLSPMAGFGGARASRPPQSGRGGRRPKRSPDATPPAITGRAGRPRSAEPRQVDAILHGTPSLHPRPCIGNTHGN